MVRGTASDLVAPVETLVADATSGDTSALFTDAESTVSGLLGSILVREAAPAPQTTATSTTSSTASGGLLGGLLSPVTGLLGGILKREAAPVPQSTSTTSSTASGGGLLGGLLSPVSSLLGGILRRDSPFEERGLLDSVTGTLDTTTTAIGSDVGSLSKGAVSVVL